MLTKKIVSLCFLVLLSVTALAQTKTVQGAVFEEETGQPLPAATVSIEGTTRGVITDLDGSFEISGVKPGDKLKFEFVGKETQIIPVGDRKNFMIKLRDVANELEGTTIVAFGKQKKESVIGSISTIDVATLKVPSSNLTTALAGNVACNQGRQGYNGVADEYGRWHRGGRRPGGETYPVCIVQ